MTIDELRSQANASFEDDSDLPLEAPQPVRFLGMTAQQSFLIALLLLLMTCILSSACLLVTGRVVPPL